MVKFHRIGRALVVLLVSFVLLSSCKPTKGIVTGEVNPKLSVKKTIQNHYNNHIEFTTLRGSFKIDYDDGDIRQNVRVSFRMKKDEVIWLSAPFNVIKAKITPTKVEFFNKLDNEYFEGEFEYLSGLLGTDIDFEKLQNVMLGNAILDLRDDKYNQTVEDNSYVLQPKTFNDIYKIKFLLEPVHFKIASQVVSQPLKGGMFNANYQYQTVSNKVVPENVKIDAVSGDKNIKVAVDYKNLEFNQELNFPYKVPSGFKKIELE
ncbi:hypothetical protein GCM10011414_05760 [Croceivirga lutea]|uniref:DUF4292 domain-containing protein n=1 Tax=Croceivirga lutea TaxID=1775167 RepID=UPI001639A3A3|nr:DUF4292 domain-containing protein [Croceivirga lutea]GGG39263.1 hypothetical protein GCM10011414_05760 [Croceivirga lutea]